MLSNTYFLAKFCFDTAENEPAKNLQNILQKTSAILAHAGGGAMTELRGRSSEGGEGGPLWSKGALVAVSLNIGGRKTNPFEFLLDGDSSKLCFSIFSDFWLIFGKL